MINSFPVFLHHPGTSFENPTSDAVIFSTCPSVIPLIKQIIRAITRDEAREVAQAALELGSPEAIQALVRERVPAANL